jgi:hypothetical protein
MSRHQQIEIAEVVTIEIVSGVFFCNVIINTMDTMTDRAE